MAEQPPRKPKVPRRKELEESYSSLEDAAAARHRRKVELFEAAAQQSKSEATDDKKGRPILHSPPKTEYPFDFNMDKSSPVRPPDAVGINGLSSGVTNPSSSEPPWSTSRRSVFEDEEGLSNPELFAPPPPGLFGPPPSELPPPQELISPPSTQELFTSQPHDLYTPQPTQELFTTRPQELFTPPAEKVVQVEHSSSHDERPSSQKLYLQFSGLTYTVCKKLSRWQRLKRAVLPGKSTHPLPKSLRLLDGISGEARDGEILAVMGPSGSGKSTLIDALAQRIDFEKGTMTLNGSQISERLLRNISAYVMQA